MFVLREPFGRVVEERAELADQMRLVIITQRNLFCFRRICHADQICGNVQGARAAKLVWGFGHMPSSLAARAVGALPHDR